MTGEHGAHAGTAGQPTAPGVPSDDQLVRAARNRDEHALGLLYDRYGGLVFTVALRVVGDRELAEEVMQDVFLRCWNGLDGFDGARGSLASWLMGIARNRAIDVLRGRQHQARLREREQLPSEGGFDPSTPDESEQVVLRETVTQAMASLSSVQTEAIELAYYGGLTQAEVATHLGQPLGTIKARIRDGLLRLRRVLDPVTGSRDGVA